MCLHQVLTGDLGDFTVLEELSVVVECHEDTGGGPRELVTKSVVGGLLVSRHRDYWVLNLQRARGDHHSKSRSS
jgi:hypothetical protein